MLKDTTDQIPLRPKEVESSRPDSPSSVLGLVTSTPTVPHAVKLTGDAFEEVLVNPLSNIPESIVPLGKTQYRNTTTSQHNGCT
jgi:hypothetical protein